MNTLENNRSLDVRCCSINGSFVRRYRIRTYLNGLLSNFGVNLCFGRY